MIVTRPTTDSGKSGRSLWYWVAAGFLFLALLWTAMIIAARSADIRTVPDAPDPHRKT